MAEQDKQERKRGWHWYDWVKTGVAGALAAALIPLSGIGGQAPVVAAPPAITVPAANAEVPVGDVTVSGTGEPGSTVEVLVDGEPVGTTQVAADGTWSLAVPIADPGTSTVIARSLADNGTTASESDPVAVTITDGGGSTAAQIQPPTIELPADPTAGTVTLRGTGMPGTLTSVLVNGQTVGAAEVADDGTWEFDADLPAGKLELRAVSLEPNTLSLIAEGEPAILTVGGADTPALAIDEPADGATIAATDDSITVSGTGTPGDELEILNNGEVVGTATVGKDGKWSFALPAAAGAASLVARTPDGTTTDPVAFTVEGTPTGVAITAPRNNATVTLDPNGNVTISGTGTPGDELEILNNGEVVGTATVGEDGKWSFALPAAAGAASLVARTPDGTTTDPVAFTVGDAPDTTLRITAPAGTQPVTLLPGTPTGTITLRGTGTPGDTIEILDNGAVVGTTTVRPDGTWRFDYPTTPGNASIALRAPDGTTTDPLNLTITDGSGQVLAITSPNTGDILEPAEDQTITIEGTGTPGEIIEILDGEQVIGTATVGDDGTWNLDYIAPDGARSLTARTANGTTTTPVAFTVGAVTGTAPTITTPAGGTAVQLGSGKTVVIGGTGTPGEEIEILDGEQAVGTAIVGEDGTWSFAYEAPAGARSLTARGPGGATSAPVAFSVPDAQETDILVVFDLSGSMAAENRIETARNGLRDFITLLGDNDRIELLTFSDERQTLSELSPLGEKRDTLLDQVANLQPIPFGGTTLYDSIIAAYNELKANGNPTRPRSVVVLTDGRDERLLADGTLVPASEATLEDVINMLQGDANDPNRVRVFTIGFGAGADQDVLRQIAEANGGSSFEAGADTLQQIYAQIARGL